VVTPEGFRDATSTCATVAVMQWPRIYRRSVAFGWRRTRAALGSLRGRVVWAVGVAVLTFALPFMRTGLGLGLPVSTWPELMARLVDAVAALSIMTLLYVLAILVFNIVAAPAALLRETEAKLHDSVSKLQQLEATRPVPSARCYTNCGNVFLDVTNSGAAAAFSCEVRFVRISDEGPQSGIPPTLHQRFRPRWDVGSEQVTIPYGGTHSVLLASVQRGGRGMSFPFLSLHAYKAFSIGWMVGYEVYDDGTRARMPPGSVVIEVTILTVPPAEKVIQRVYSINANGGVEEVAG
jgi:hypothetical protein